MTAEVSPLAGKPAPASMLVNVPRLVTAYFAGKPDPKIPSQRVAFGTSGHRGSALNSAFNEAHILAISQALCDHRRRVGIDGPLFMGIDTHALAEPAFASALEVFAANEVTVMIDERDARHLACDPELQPKPNQRPCRRRGNFPLAQSS
jgi:phosphoglucomutase